MKFIETKKDFDFFFNNAKLQLPEYLKLEKFGELAFNCACGELHSLNDEYYAKKLFAVEPNKILYMCGIKRELLTFIEINKGIINDETKSLGVIRADSDLWNEYCMDSIKKNKTYSNIKKLLE
tara:strand:- start:151 stop:519 length:369 start_codon:yes stop_codon:yes gene_type:complete